jgi:hypothetical protein
VLGSSLSYAAPAEAVVAQGAKLGQSIHFTKRDIPGTESIDKLSGTVLAVFGVLVLIKFVSLLISALIVTMVFKDFTLELSERTVKKFWMKAGVGFIVLVVGPVAMFALAISFVGLYLALLLGLLYGLVLVIAGIYSCILTGALLSRFIKKEVRVNWKWTVLGTVVLFAVSFVPFIGWVACAFVYCASIGAIAMSVMRDAKGKMHLPA